MKKILIICSQIGFSMISDLPYLFKKGGFRVVVISPAYWLIQSNSFIDEWIEVGGQDNFALLRKGDELKESFDLVLLSSDELAWDLYKTDFAKKLSPIKNPTYFNVLEGKIGVALFCEKAKILNPPFKIVKNLQEALLGALEMGFPVMLKMPQSAGGKGIVKCDTLMDLENISFPSPLLLEKYIEGEVVNVEPFFFESKLVAYNYSLSLFSKTPYAPSLKRLFKPYPHIEPLLDQIGQALFAHGIFNLTFIKEKGTGLHYLTELDCRPNKWVRYGRFAGVDWIQAIKSLKGDPVESPKKEKIMNHFPETLFGAMEQKNIRGILYWIFNREGSWQYLPYYDVRLCCRGFFRFIRKLSSYRN